jgi:hypothetical protein
MTEQPQSVDSEELIGDVFYWDTSSLNYLIRKGVLAKTDNGYFTLTTEDKKLIYTGEFFVDNYFDCSSDHDDLVIHKRLKIMKNEDALSNDPEVKERVVEKETIKRNNGFGKQVSVTDYAVKNLLIEESILERKDGIPNVLTGYFSKNRKKFFQELRSGDGKQLKRSINSCDVEKATDKSDKLYIITIFDKKFLTILVPNKETYKIYNMAVSGIYYFMKHGKKMDFFNDISDEEEEEEVDGDGEIDDNDDNDDNDDGEIDDNDDNDDNDDDCRKQENFLLVNCDKGIEDQIIFEASLPKNFKENNKITICHHYYNLSITHLDDGTFNIIDNKNNKIANAKIITKEEKEKKEKEEEEFKKAFIENKNNREDAKKKIYDFLRITDEEKEEIESINTKLRVIGNNGGKRNSVRRKKNKKSKTIKTVYRKNNLQSSRKSRKSRKH